MTDNSIDPTDSRGAVQEGEREKDENFYRGKWILAPMVRIGILPFRLECLKYGAGKTNQSTWLRTPFLSSVCTPGWLASTPVFSSDAWCRERKEEGRKLIQSVAFVLVASAFFSLPLA